MSAQRTNDDAEQPPTSKMRAEIGKGRSNRCFIVPDGMRCFLSVGTANQRLAFSTHRLVFSRATSRKLKKKTHGLFDGQRDIYYVQGSKVLTEGLVYCF